MKKKPIYTIVKTNRKKKVGEKIRVSLNENSKYPGVVFEYTNIKMLPEPTEDGSNCQIEYNIVKVPRGKFKNLDDDEKIKFDNIVRDIFRDLLATAYNDLETVDTK